jgi:hypothetical protein
VWYLLHSRKYLQPKKIVKPLLLLSIDQREKPPGSSWIVEILRLKFLPEKKGHTTIFASILCIINEFEIKI